MNGLMVFLYLIAGMIIGTCISFFGKFLKIHLYPKKEDGSLQEEKNEPED